MEQRSKLGASGACSSDSTDCMHQTWLFLPCSARRGPGDVVSRKMELQQYNGKSEIGKNWSECPDRKDNNFGERSAKKPHPWQLLPAGRRHANGPSMLMRWLVPHTGPESQCELSSLAEGCQVLAFQSCSLLWLVAVAGGLLCREAKTDR